MSKWFNRAVVAAGLGLVSCLIAVSSTAAEEAQSATEVAEDSVLVATREASSQAGLSAATSESESTTAADGETLEPISEVAEHTPELATTSEASPPEEVGEAAAEAVAEAKPAGGEAVAEEATSNDASTVSADDASEFGAALAKVAEAGDVPTSPLGGVAPRVAEPGTVPYEPAKFHGIGVGRSSGAELAEAWGQPAETTETADGVVLIYDMEPFQAVEVLVADDVVMAIKISLAANLEPKHLAKQLSLDEFEPVTVSDEDGQGLGMAFPERGVLFMFTAGEDALIPSQEESDSARVSHVVIQPLDARAFALRAENHLHGPYQQNVRDLKTALALEPELAHAQWLLAEIYLATGQGDLAEAASADACELEPTSGTFQLCHARAAALLGQYDEAVHAVRQVLDREDLPLLVRAQALHEMARLASLGDVQIAAKAIPFDTKAIELADKVATSENTKDRRAAKLLLVEAHLAIAEEVARQAFNNKVEALSMWVGRASGLAEDFINNDGGSVELRLKIAQSALGAMASFKPTLDPAPWIKEAEEAAKSLARVSDESLWQQHVEWELGIAYYNALRVEHLRQETESAQHYGQEAILKLAEGAASRQAVHASEQLVGHLYFYLGAVEAVHKQDHQQAAEWYDKAVPMLTGPRPVSELYSPRREGEVLVSMGVTYWQLGQQTRALELTQTGASLVELAVEDGILAKTALAVPYGNLASMYEQMGETTNASKYAKMADTASKAAPQVSPRTGSRLMPTNVRTASTQSGGSPMRMNGQQPRMSGMRR